MDYIKAFSRTNIRYDGAEYSDYDDVAVEDSITLFVNDIRIATLVASPDMLRELCIGYLLSEGVVTNFYDIQEVVIDENKMEAYSKVSSFDQVELWHEIRSSGCIGVKWWTNEDIRVVSDARFGKQIIKESLQFLNTYTRQKTHGVHTAALFSRKGELQAQAVDVGRHSAVDKVIGAFAGNDFSYTFLLSSGRQPAGMVLKAARAGIPLIVSKAAPINTGIESALQTGVTLVCFAGVEQFSVYSHRERIE
ncbi:MAG TPA: formate dehydrogenase accessory sulfurtransferase FdhD [Candidatus Acidoferrales bacterium]|nr:formate dehydrogenase accessory sulfurtransferase FdhD [Candidatus Acidoferrales bacterium]